MANILRKAKRPPIKLPSLVAEISDDAKKSLLRLHTVFSRDIPQEARIGTFDAAAHPVFSAESYRDIADGRYRVNGGEWIYWLKGGKLLFVEGATADNNFGGDAVTHVVVSPL